MALRPAVSHGLRLSNAKDFAWCLPVRPKLLLRSSPFGGLAISAGFDLRRPIGFASRLCSRFAFVGARRTISDYAVREGAAHCAEYGKAGPPPARPYAFGITSYLLLPLLGKGNKNKAKGKNAHELLQAFRRHRDEREGFLCRAGQAELCAERMQVAGVKIAGMQILRVLACGSAALAG